VSCVPAYDLHLRSISRPIYCDYIADRRRHGVCRVIKDSSTWKILHHIAAISEDLLTVDLDEERPKRMTDIAGIDSGLTLRDRTSGACRTGTSGFVLDHTYVDKLSRAQLLLPVVHIDCLGVDAPILPKNTLHYNPMPVESLFMRGPFQTRCKPGASHVAGTGRALRRSGCDLGVMLDGDEIDKAKPDRGAKTDTFFSLCTHGVFQALQRHLGWEDSDFWTEFPITIHHDERAALVCAVTAVCAYKGRYVAVGDVSGGYFFLPPWPLWKPWAIRALDDARQAPGLLNVVNVWIDGQVFDAGMQLP
jgi:hypothetical protein